MMYKLLIIFNYTTCCIVGMFIDNEEAKVGNPVNLTCFPFMANAQDDEQVACIKTLKLLKANHSEDTPVILAMHTYTPGKPYESQVLFKKSNWRYSFSAHTVKPQGCEDQGHMKIELHISRTEISDTGDYICEMALIGDNQSYAEVARLTIHYVGEPSTPFFTPLTARSKKAVNSCSVQLADVILACLLVFNMLVMHAV